jgi:hypothetical protein
MRVRRKVRRRGINSWLSGMDTSEVISLLGIAVVTSALTATIVWSAAKVYTALGGGSGPFTDNSHSHRHGKNRHPRNHHDDDSDDDGYEALPWNPIYRIPEAMETVGDRSDAYATLRKEMDAILPPDTERSLARVQELREAYPRLTTHRMTEEHSDTVPYDIYHCPPTPPPGYPFEWKLVDQVLHSWPVTTVDEIPNNQIHQGLCVFDYQKDYATALAYRQAELPFVVVNDPAVARTVERWHIPGYLPQLIGGPKHNIQHRAEYNTNSHFLYHQPHRPKRRRRHGEWHNVDEEKEEAEKAQLQDLQGRQAALQRADVVPEAIRMTYDDWLAKANKTHVGPEEEHWYFRLIGCGYMDTSGQCDQGSSEYLFDEMPYFQPRNDDRNTLYLGDPSEQKGIHCRFGMKGVIAENHFDASRNGTCPWRLPLQRRL